MMDDLQTFDPCPGCGAQGEQLRGRSRYECDAGGCPLVCECGHPRSDHPEFGEGSDFIEACRECNCPSFRPEQIEEAPDPWSPSDVTDSWEWSR